MGNKLDESHVATTRDSVGGRGLPGGKVKHLEVLWGWRSRETDRNRHRETQTGTPGASPQRHHKMSRPDRMEEEMSLR